MNSKREAGKIISVSYGKEDHGILTFWATIDFGGSFQGFGGLMLDKEKSGPAFIDALCSAFNVRGYNALVGKKCFALRCFGFLNDHIEGLESESGKRFTLTGWRRSMGFESMSPLDQRKDGLKLSIASAERQIKEAKDQLKKADAEYTEWL